jgi:hypothetical protein
LGPQTKIAGGQELGRATLRRPVEPVAEPAPELAPEPGPPSPWRRLAAAVLQGALSLAVVAGGYVGYQQIMAAPPVAERA